MVALNLLDVTFIRQRVIYEGDINCVESLSKSYCFSQLGFLRILEILLSGEEKRVVGKDVVHDFLKLGWTNSSKNWGQI